MSCTLSPSSFAETAVGVSEKDEIVHEEKETTYLKLCRYLLVGRYSSVWDQGGYWEKVREKLVGSNPR